MSTLSAIDQNVLEAIANSLEFEVYSIESNEGRLTVHGLSWERLLLMSDLTTPELQAATIRLTAAGLITSGGDVPSAFDLLLGDRPAELFWATTKGHEWVNAHTGHVDPSGEGGT